MWLSWWRGIWDPSSKARQSRLLVNPHVTLSLQQNTYLIHLHPSLRTLPQYHQPFSRSYPNSLPRCLSSTNLLPESSSLRQLRQQRRSQAYSSQKALAVKMLPPLSQLFRIHHSHTNTRSLRTRHHRAIQRHKTCI